MEQAACDGVVLIAWPMSFFVDDALRAGCLPQKAKVRIPLLLPSNRHSSFADLGEKPLLGAVICCTSISPEQRTLLADYALSMGAEHKLDLTSDVTHLLVGDTDTPKYKYVAREREDVKVLSPKWVEAVRARWMADQHIDHYALEAEYSVPTLAGLKICITGFDDMTFRAGIAEDIKKHGGTYSGDLTKDTTHLIAAKPEGQKYQYAILWGLKTVSLKWYSDTKKRGMQLDEALYHPSKPIEEQGRGAWNQRPPGQQTLGKRTGTEVALEPLRKLRRTASAKLGSQTDNIWNEIVNGGGEEIRKPRDKLRTSKSMPVMGDSAQGSPEELPSAVAQLRHGFLDGSYFVIMGFDAKKVGILWLLWCTVDFG